MDNCALPRAGQHGEQRIEEQSHDGLRLSWRPSPAGASPNAGPSRRSRDSRLPMTFVNVIKCGTAGLLDSRSYTLERAVCPRARLPARPSPALFGGGTGLTRRMVGILRIATPSVADCEPMAADPRYFAKGSVESTPMSTRLSIAAKAAAQVSRLPSRSRSRSRFQSVARLAASPIGLATGVGASSANALGAFTSLITALPIAPR